jgi:hypothetical protein
LTKAVYVSGGFFRAATRPTSKPITGEAESRREKIVAAVPLVRNRKVQRDTS